MHTIPLFRAAFKDRPKIFQVITASLFSFCIMVIFISAANHQPKEQNLRNQPRVKINQQQPQADNALSLSAPTNK